MMLRTRLFFLRNVAFGTLLPHCSLFAESLETFYLSNFEVHEKARVQILKDGSVVLPVSGVDGRAWLWKSFNPNEQKECFTAVSNGLIFSPDQRLAFTISADGAPFIEHRWAPPGHKSWKKPQRPLSYSNDGNRPHLDPYSLRCDNTGRAVSGRFSPDSERIAIIDFDSSISIWDTNSNKRIAFIDSLAGDVDPLRNSVEEVGFSFDNTYFWVLRKNDELFDLTVYRMKNLLNLCNVASVIPDTFTQSSRLFLRKVQSVVDPNAARLMGSYSEKCTMSQAGNFVYCREGGNLGKLFSMQNPGENPVVIIFPEGLKNASSSRFLPDGKHLLIDVENEDGDVRALMF